jgi:phosphoglycerate dehydrogenase-like enzyme
MDRTTFAMLKHGAILVNTSRGGVVDDRALLAALRSGRLSGAALDVIETERGDRTDWLQAHPLRAYAARHSNLILTPHIGGATCESMCATETFMASKLARYIEENSDRFEGRDEQSVASPHATKRRSSRR